MRFSSTTAALAAVLAVPASVTWACTTVAVSKEASSTGVAMLAHSADCFICDSRVALVPARDHQEGEEHEVFGINQPYPRAYNRRAAIYLPPAGKNFTEPSARIPEVPRTYGMWESNYPLMNEEGLTVGESSTSSKVPGGFGVDLADPKTGQYGEAKFSIKELIRVGLERCTTAECAIREMGATAEKYGFYPESVGAGESLTVADTKGSAWVFDISHDSTGKSAIWAAQRVPAGHVAAIANQYTIKEIKEDEPDNYMFSPNVKSEALKLGLWDGKSPFSFVGAYGVNTVKPSYTSIRLWAIFNLVAPNSGLEFNIDPFELPFSVPAEKSITREDLMNIFRTNYEDTPFDMTNGILAGVYHNPYRIEGGDGLTQVPGEFARGISIPRTTYSMLGYPDPANPVVFYGTDQPSSSVFVPFLAKTLKEASANDLEGSKKLYSSYYQLGNRADFSTARDSAWWAFDFVSNWMNMNYQNMSEQYVKPAIAEWQPKMIAAADAATTTEAMDAQSSVVKAWWDLSDKLVVRYNDGYYSFPESDPEKVFYMGYPADYLAQIGFNKDYIYPKYVQAAGTPLHADTMVERVGMSYWSVAVAVVVALLVGVFAGRVSTKKQRSVVSDTQKRLLASEH
ncbi:hypothetical protein FOZ61_011030 [Perkinsus olseni]|uniref:Peptidase n=1 Tax=Perkinsus olseni TaxID=32597 RepID=A0A7J6M1E9_PEROL|nr:hypothetical protein FOZ61_011030 [Perkinsus olseni]